MVMYRHALLRRPGANFSAGLTTQTMGRPDWRKALRQHEAYAAALRDCGLEVTVLDADERFPDGCFVEDTAVIAGECAVITRPGAGSRRGEERRIAEVLGDSLRLERITAPGTLEGGDVLRVGSQFFIGLSGRTNRAGAEQLQAVLEREGFSTTLAPVPEMLHLKTGVARLDDRRLVLTDELAGQPAFQTFERIVVAPEEAYAANCLSVNGVLLIARGYPAFRQAVTDLGVPVVELDMSEFCRMDGGLTCLSLLW